MNLINIPIQNPVKNSPFEISRIASKKLRCKDESVPAGNPAVDKRTDGEVPGGCVSYINQLKPRVLKKTPLNEVKYSGTDRASPGSK